MGRPALREEIADFCEVSTSTACKIAFAIVLYRSADGSRPPEACRPWGGWTAGRACRLTQPGGRAGLRGLCCAVRSRSWCRIDQLPSEAACSPGRRAPGVFGLV